MAAAPTSQPLYRSDFSAAPAGALPPDMRAVMGDFAVAEDKGARYLESPAAPIQANTLMVGPETGGFGQIQASIHASTRGQRYPEFGLALGGMSGHKLWLMPITGQLQIVKNDQVLASAPFAWRSGSWTILRLRISSTADGCLIQGKAWDASAAEPALWAIELPQPSKPPAGRAILYATPYAETPIAFDRIIVASP